MASASDPLEECLAEESAPAYRPLQRVRAMGVGIAWFAAVACGWHSFQQGDLLSAALRGAMAWLGIISLWVAGVILCERLIARPANDPRIESGGD
jgi:hypothetical protein